MSQQKLLKKVFRVLSGAGIEYMLSGSLASSLQGEPRSTHDIDIVISMGFKDIPVLMRAFPPPNYYLDEASIRESIEKKGMFNLLDINTGDKVDFWMLTDEPFDRSRFQRKNVEYLMGMGFAVSSPEDTILMKLKWAELSGRSEKQFTDALRVYEVQFGKLDLEYLRTWAEELRIGNWLSRLQEEAEVL
jgi:hypothetical protein